jgi:hypothetical protein
MLTNFHAPTVPFMPCSHQQAQHSCSARHIPRRPWQRQAKGQGQVLTQVGTAVGVTPVGVTPPAAGATTGTCSRYMQQPGQHQQQQQQAAHAAGPFQLPPELQRQRYGTYQRHMVGWLQGDQPLAAALVRPFSVWSGCRALAPPVMQSSRTPHYSGSDHTSPSAVPATAAASLTGSVSTL